MATNVSYLDKLSSAEWDELVLEYPYQTMDWLDAKAKELGYKNKSSFMDAMVKRGVKRAFVAPQYAPEKEEREPIINLSPVKLRTFKPIKKGRGDPETQVLLLGDHHAGEITSTYNKNIYKQRLQELAESAMTITQLHRNMYPVNDLVIVMGGDMVHGENPRQGATIGTVECGAQEQVYDIALPELQSLILSLKQEFKTVSLYCVRGNHGYYSRYAPKTSNWDMMLYKALRATLKPYNIETDVSNDFCNLFDIQGFRFFAFHGDQIRMTQGIPYFALSRKVKSWFITYGGFSYALCFHCHEDDIHRVSAKTKAFINGPLPTDDPFALEVIGTSAIPTQWTFGVHNRIGISWAYSLVVDYGFLPDKIK